jgi:hypothetical protein
MNDQIIAVSSEPSDDGRKRLLQQCEDVLDRGRKNQSSFVQQGQSLWTIREGKLHKEKGYSTFETYCHDEWEITRQRASQLILAFQFEKENPTPHGEKRTERKIRNLRRQKPNRGSDDKPKPRSEKEQLFYDIERSGMELNLQLRRLTEVEDQRIGFGRIAPIVEWIQIVEVL